MVTLADVARSAGVSLATASRVFGKPAMVGPDTTAKVRNAAAALGYVANPTARALATGSSGLLGLIVPDLSSPYFAPLISAIQTEIEGRGFELIVSDSRGVPGTEHEIVQRLQGRVDGLILASPRNTDSVLISIARRLPIVTVNRELPGIDSVSIDVSDGLADLCRFLLDHGHQRIAYIGGPPGSLADDGRFQSVEAAMEAGNGTALRIGPVQPNAQAGAETLSAIQLSNVSAVIAYNALVAHGLMLAAVSEGLNVPRDLTVTAVDDLIDIGLSLPTVTAITQPMTEVGQKSAGIILALISGSHEELQQRPPHQAQHLVLSASLSVNKS